MVRLALATAMVLVAIPASAAPPAREAGALSGPAADATHVEVHDGTFSPTTVPIPRGGTVIFDFVGDDHHTATDASGLHLYDSGLVDGKGTSISFAFQAAGAYRFTCTPHPTMGGRVEVPVRAAPRRGNVGDDFTVTWAAAPPAEGFVQDVQVRAPGARWTTWRDGVVGTGRAFRPRDAGVYRFRARLRDASAASSAWSAPADITVRS